MLLTKKITFLDEYSDSDNVFLKELAKILPKRTETNEHVIKLEKSKYPPYGPIYSLSLVELKILKTYIETNLANNFIQPLKCLARAFIFFI